MPERKLRGTRWTDGLTFRFAAVFVVFTVITIVAATIGTRASLENFYHDQCVSHIASVAKHLEREILSDSETFESFQDYLIEHVDEIIVPADFDECETDRLAFERDFMAEYPDKIFGVDVSFDELTDDLKHSFCTYYFKYWQLLFEDAREDFDVPYTYYIMPTGVGSHILYILDVERLEDEEAGDGRLIVIDDAEEDLSTMPQFVATWETGEIQGEVDVFENEYGYTCSYYIPLHIGDREMGVICVDGDVAEINRDVRQSTTNLVVALSVIVIFGVCVLVLYINREYVSKLTQLNERVEEYTRDKDAQIANQIEENVDGNDEIATLSHQIASMIGELENHIESIVSISGELTSARDRAAKLTELARTDSMTGLGNKLAYTECLDELDESVKAGNADFTMIVIDLNFLKRINDTYGHDKGDFAIRRLAECVAIVFGENQAFRIGGDEFCVVLTGDQCLTCTRKVAELKALIGSSQGSEPWERISAAIGWCHQEGQESAREVFEKADANMYENKVAMKAARQG